MNWLKTLTISLLATFLGGSFDASAADPSASDIAQKSYDSSKVADSTSDATFKLVNSAGQERIRETTGGTKLIKGTTDNMRITTFMSPSDVKGTKTLLIEHTGKDDDIWIYLPALKKVRRLVANNKKDSFVGTDFSYGDIIGHKVEDWTHTLVGTEQIDGVETYVVESVPRTEKVRDDSGYGKRRTWIRHDNFVAVKGTYWDLAGAVVKELTATDVREIDPAHHKWQAFTLTMRNT